MDKRLVLFLSFLIFLLCIASVNAYESDAVLQSESDVYYVNYDDDSFDDIKTVLDEDGQDKVIYINSGVYSGLNNTNLTIDGNIQLIGNNVDDTVIDGEFLNNIFTVTESSSVYLSNLTFVGGYDLCRGGAISNYGKLSIDNCLFVNNYVFNDDFSTVYGAAVYNEGKLTVNSSSFIGNYLGSPSQKFSFGGAIYTKGNLLINNSYFSENSADSFIYTKYLTEVPHVMELTRASIPQRGGAIAGESNNVVVCNSVFENNVLSSFYDAYFDYPTFRRVSSGGAIDIIGNNLVVDNCIFNNNSADVGGAVSFAGDNISFSGNNFTHNSAYTGGALYSGIGEDDMDYYGTTVYVIHHDIKISDCLFRQNFLNPRDVSIKHDYIPGFVQYEFNYAGGAVYLDMNNVLISNSTFLSNTFDVDYDYDNTTQQVESRQKYANFCYGGAVYSKGENSSIDGCYFVNNYGDIGGALYSSGANSIISNSYFAFNIAVSRDGGAVYHIDGDRFTLSNSTFIGNNASNAGGAVSSIASIMEYDELIENPHSRYEDCNFINNTASLGGAIYDSGDRAGFDNLTFIFNSALSGGAIYNNGFNDNVVDCSFIANTAFGADYSNGGAIYNSGSNTKISSSNFRNNSADYLGGSIYHTGSNFRLNECEFSYSNSFYGGAIYLNGHSGRVENSIFNANSAACGGAVYNNAVNFRISDNRFTNSRANISGGAIHNSASVLSLYNNQMFGCFAGLYGDYIYTNADISYLTVSVLNNDSVNILDHKNTYLFANITDNLGNPVTGGNVSFLIYNPAGDEYIDVGVSSLYEGIAYIEYGQNLDLGLYKLYADYIYAGEPVLSEIGTVLSLSSSELHVTINTDLDFIGINDTFNLNIVLVDGEGNYIENAEIQIYENYRYVESVFTNSQGFYNYTSKNIFHLGSHNFTLIYDGDLIHDSASVEFNFTIVYDVNIDYKKTNIISYYPLVYTIAGAEIPFEFKLNDAHGKDLGNVRLNSFQAFRNGEYIMDSGIYSVDVYGEKSHYLTSKDGTFFLPVVENEPGVYVYTVFFTGLNLPMDDIYYAATNTSVILIIRDDAAVVDTKFDIAHDSFNEVQLPSFNVSLKDVNGNVLEGMNVSVYESGNYITSFITGGDVFNFTLPYYLDKGEHLIEVVFGGFENYSASFDAFYLEIADNPNKKDVFFDLNSLRLAYGEGNSFKISLLDEDGALLRDLLVDVEMFFNDVSVKNYTINISNFNIPLNYGSGVYAFNCSFEGNRYYWNSSAEFIIDVKRISTELYGVGAVEVLDENTFLSYVLVGDNYTSMPNRKIRMDVYSYALNTTFYAFTNNESFCSWKVNLPVGKYVVLAYFEGEKWWEASPKVLTNLTVWGDSSKLMSMSDIVKKKGYYTVKLTDSEGNPLKGKDIFITINGKAYKRTTDDEGYASLKINLNYGKYDISSAFMGDLNYKQSAISSILYVVDDDYMIPTLLSADNSLTFRFNNQEFSLQLTDSLKIPLANRTVRLLIGNEKYEAVTDGNGIVRYDLNLSVGTYDFKAFFDGDEDYKSGNCSKTLVIVDDTAESTMLNAPQYLVFEEKGNYFNVTLTDKRGNPLANQTVVIEINGHPYVKTTDSNGRARLKINLNPGSYEIYCHFDGSFSYFFSQSATKLVMIESVKLNLTKLSGKNKITLIGKGKYSVNLTDELNNPLANKRIVLTVNGISYTRVTDNMGSVSLNINLKPDNYYISAVFDGDDDYRHSNTLTTVLAVKPTITRMGNFEKYYRSSEQFSAKFLDCDGLGVADAAITMNINGVFYTRNTNENGTFKLNINLAPGDYILTATDPSGISNSFKITVLPTIIVNDLIKVYKNESQYVIKVLNASGDPSANSNVTININGVFYNRTTDENGIAVLNINLRPGKYIATVMDLNNGLQMSSTVLVLSAPAVFKSENGAFIKKGESCVVSLKCSDGKAICGEKVGIEINGKVYNRTTDSNGLASLKINLNKGTYLLRYYWYFNNQTLITNIRVT